MSISNIKVALGEIDDKIAALDRDLDAASVFAIRNPELGESKIAEIQARIAVEKAKRGALANELDAARRRAYEANLAAEEAARAGHMRDARGHAKRVVALAGKVDQAVASWKALLAELGEAETATRSSLRAAGVAPGDSVVGRQGIANRAIERMSISLTERERYANNRPIDIAAIARTAWSDLIEGQGDAD